MADKPAIYKIQLVTPDGTIIKSRPCPYHKGEEDAFEYLMSYRGRDFGRDVISLETGGYPAPGQRLFARLAN